MALPTTILCQVCQADLPVTRTNYNGLRQPDPTQDGFHSYTVEAECPHCHIRIVVVHQESQPV